jgi:hypothetical protein
MRAPSGEKWTDLTEKFPLKHALSTQRGLLVMHQVYEGAPDVDLYSKCTLERHLNAWIVGALEESNGSPQLTQSMAGKTSNSS